MRDPAADIHFEGTQVVRTLRAPLQRGHFLHSDMAKRWVREGRLVAFESADALTITSPRLPFVTHPFEWCDAQLFGAAQLTLDLQQEGVEHSHDLKDASAWNIIFDGCRPMFCDLLSFSPLRERKWWAMGQYARHFLLPLLVSRQRGLRGYQSFSMWRDGVPTEAARRILGPAIFLTRYGTLLLGSKTTDHAMRAKPAPEDNAPADGVVRFRSGLQAALQWMLAGVNPAQHSRAATSDWSGYEQDRTHYAAESLIKKRATVAEWLRRTDPEWVVDLGCNTGEFSRMAAEQGACVVALDADHDSIQHIYRTSASHLRLYPAVAQLDDISGGRGWRGTEHSGLAERMHNRFDLVMMLALIHHLSIGASVPLSAVARWAHACSRDRVIVEFIDEADPQLISLCAQRQRSPAEFGVERQRAAFVEAGFDIEMEVDLLPTMRWLALLRKRS